jgi:hypothetical protein
MFESGMEVGDCCVGIYDADRSALEKRHYSLRGVNVHVRVLDKVLQRGSLFPKLETSTDQPPTLVVWYLWLNRVHRTVMGASTLINMKNGRLAIISKSSSVQISTVTKFSRHRTVT